MKITKILPPSKPKRKPQPLDVVEAFDKGYLIVDVGGLVGGGEWEKVYAGRAEYGEGDTLGYAATLPNTPETRVIGRAVEVVVEVDDVP